MPFEVLAGLPFFVFLPLIYIAGFHHNIPISRMVVATYMSLAVGTGLYVILFFLSRISVTPLKRELAAAGVIILVAGGSVYASIGTSSSSLKKYKAASTENIIILSVDTLRQDVLGCYGSRAGLTPAIDGLAEDGIVFENAFSPSPWTLPAFGTLFTGLYPGVHGGGKILPHEEMEDARPVSGKLTYLAEILSGAGYDTVAFYTNSWLSPHQNMDHGFETYVRLDVEDLAPQNIFLPSRAFLYLYRTIRKDLRPPGFQLNGPQQEWISFYHDGPFFLWVHFLDPHLPYKLHPELENFYKGLSGSEKDLSENTNIKELAGLKKSSRPRRAGLYRLYEGEVKYTDLRLAKLIKLLKKSGLYEDSLIIFLSDHGEEFWDHDGFEHGHTHYNELVRVPLIIKLPGNRHAGKRIDANTGIVDIAPTVVDHAGIDYRGTMQGTSLMPLIAGQMEKTESAYFSQFMLYGPDKQAVINGRRKLVLRKGKPLLYFDLDNDPHEKNNLLKTDPERAKPLFEKYKSWSQSCREIKEDLVGDFEKRDKGWDPEELQKLRDLGYLE